MAVQPYTITTYNDTSSQFNNLLRQIAGQEAEAKSANVQRQAQIEAIFDEIIARYGPEGTYGKSAEMLLEQQKVRDVGAVAQRDISRGTYGMRPYEQEWEAAVGAPARLKLEDIKMERLSQAQLGKAQFLTGIEDEYPDYSMLAQLASQIGQQPSGSQISYGGASGTDLGLGEGLGTVQWGTSATTPTAAPTYAGTPESPYIPGVGSVGGDYATAGVAQKPVGYDKGTYVDVPGYGRMTVAENDVWVAKWRAAGKPGTLGEFIKSGDTTKKTTPSYSSVYQKPMI